MIFLICLGILAAYGLFFAINNIEPQKNKSIDQLRSAIAYNRKKCSNKFETDIFDCLVSMGYYPLTQVKEGRYRLDFVLIENKKRIVIEADGDIFHNKAHDQKRDNYLKKIGYANVIRIKYSRWKENKIQCIQNLELKLYKLKHLPESHPSFQMQFETK